MNDAFRSRSSSTSSSCGSRRPSTCSLRSRARRTWISYSPSCGNVYGINAPPRVPIGSPSTCSSWVRSGRMRIVSPPGDRPGLPDGQAADLLRRGDVAVQERRREVAHRHVVEPVAGLVARQQRRGIDVERQEVADGVLVFGPVEPPERVGPAGIGFLGGRAVERAGEQGDERRRTSRPDGRTSSSGGIWRATSFRTTFSQAFGFRLTSSELIASRAKPAVLSSRLWHATQYRSTNRPMASRSFEPPGEDGGAACCRAAPELMKPPTRSRIDTPQRLRVPHRFMRPDSDINDR